jgi:hypothetical protein
MKTTPFMVVVVMVIVTLFLIPVSFTCVHRLNVNTEQSTIFTQIRNENFFLIHGL